MENVERVFELMFNCLSRISEDKNFFAIITIFLLSINEYSSRLINIADVLTGKSKNLNKLDLEDESISYILFYSLAKTVLKRTSEDDTVYLFDIYLTKTIESYRKKPEIDNDVNKLPIIRELLFIFSPIFDKLNVEGFLKEEAKQKISLLFK